MIIPLIYVGNIPGRLSDAHYMRMSAGYEVEQKRLSQTIAESETRLKEIEQNSVDLKLPLTTLREATDITNLNQTLVSKLIQRIRIHGNGKSTSTAECAYFTAVRMVSLSDEEEIPKILQELQRPDHPPHCITKEAVQSITSYTASYKILHLAPPQTGWFLFYLYIMLIRYAPAAEAAAAGSGKGPVRSWPDPVKERAARIGSGPSPDPLPRCRRHRPA